MIQIAHKHYSVNENLLKQDKLYISLKDIGVTRTLESVA